MVERNACLLELGGAEVDLIGGVLQLHDLLEGVVGGVRLALQVTLQQQHTHILIPSCLFEPQ